MVNVPLFTTLNQRLASIAGHMWAMTEAFISPELLGWHRSAEGLLAILLGGIGALHGPSSPASPLPSDTGNSANSRPPWPWPQRRLFYCSMNR